MIAVAFIGGLVGTWLARRIAWRFAIVARPNPIVPQHRQPVAYLGGLGIAIGAGAALATGVSAPAGFVIGALGFTALGTLDDLRPLQPRGKLLAQLAVALAAVVIAAPEASAIDLATRTLWIAVVVNAVNLTDVCDGLVGSLAIIALGASGLATGQPLAFVVAGATAGFLWFNRPPATIFLGDAGSHLLGFALGYLWLGAADRAATWHHRAAAVLGVGSFLLELGFLVIVRHRRGLAFWRGSPDHLALRLQAAGLSKQRTIAVAVIPTALLNALAIWLARSSSLLALALAAGLVVVLVLGVARLYALEPVPRFGRPRQAGDPL